MQIIENRFKASNIYRLLAREKDLAGLNALSVLREQSSNRLRETKGRASIGWADFLRLGQLIPEFWSN